MTTIKFFGTGMRYWVCEIPESQFNLIEKEKIAMNKVWEELFFDLEFLEQFGYSNWESIHLLEEGKGWLIAERNRIEIKTGKKKRVVEMREFLGDGLLFDAFKKEIIAFEVLKKANFTYVLLVQLDAGLINKFEVVSDDFDLDKSNFTFYDGTDVNIDLLWLTKVEYNGQELFDLGDDCLTRQNIVSVL